MIPDNNDYNDYNDYTDFIAYNDYNDYKDLNQIVTWTAFAILAMFENQRGKKVTTREQQLTKT